MPKIVGLCILLSDYRYWFSKPKV